MNKKSKTKTTKTERKQNQNQMRQNLYLGVQVKPVKPSTLDRFCRKMEILDLQVLN